MKTQIGPFWKKMGLVTAGLLVFLFVGAGLLPSVIDVDKYRPEILEKINSEINGSLTLGKLKLSLWGTISVKAEGAELLDASNKSVLSVSDVKLTVPVFSLVKLSPLVKIEMKTPKVNIVRSKTGSWNVTQLLKQNSLREPKSNKEINRAENPPQSESSSKQSSTPAQSLVSQSTPNSSSEALPAWIHNASVGLDIADATINVTDEKMDHHYSMRKIYVLVDSLSLSRPSAFKVAAQIDNQFGPQQSVRGPFEVKGNLKGNDLEVEANGDKLNITWGQSFQKNESMKAELTFKMNWYPNQINLDRGKFRIHQAVVDWQGRFQELFQPEGPKFNFEIKAHDIDLKGISELIPMARDYQVAGGAYLVGMASGTVLQPQAKFQLGLKKGQIGAETFKQKVDLNGELYATLERVEKSWLQLATSGFDIRADLRVESLLSPRFQLDIQSKEMDLDQLVDWEKRKKITQSNRVEKTNYEVKNTEKNGKVEVRTEQKEEGRAVPVPDFDAPLALLRESTIAQKTSGNFTFDFKSIKSHGVAIEKVKGKGGLKNLKLDVLLTDASLFDGKVKGDMQFDLSARRPEYSFKVSTTQLDLQKAVSSQWALFKNTMTGVLTGEFNGTGTSFDPVLARKNLNSSGKMKVEKAVLSTVDINPFLTESVNQGINKIAEKIPSLRGKTVKVDKVSGEFQQVTSSFSIKDGVFRSPDFFAQAVPGKGVDLKGETEVGLIDYAFRADWELVDTYNLTKLKDLSVEEAGVRVESLLVERGQPLKIPIKIRGTLLSPQYEYAFVPEYLGRIALANISRAVQERAKTEATKKAQEELKKVTDQGAQKVKDALKGLFGH